MKKGACLYMGIGLEELIAPIKGTKFSKLRQAQEEILRIYASEASSIPDIAIELPTGAGKTLIALLILEYCRKEGKIVAILSGNKTLARQIESEASDLRVPTVRFEGSGNLFSGKDLRDYRRSQAIGLMNYWVYINQSPAVEPADILALDDAQLAEGALSSLFSVKIGRYEHPKLFNQAMRLFAQYTDSSVADDHIKGLEKVPWGPTDLVPFPDFVEMQNELEALIDHHLKEADDDAEWKDLSFRWSRLRHKALQALVFLSNDEIILRPYIYPFQDFPHFSHPAQRIYMSATIHDPDDLRRRLGTPPIVKLAMPPELVKEEHGRRLFVFNQTSSPSSRSEPPDEVLVPLKEILKSAKKSVWLCCSGREAKRWKKWVEQLEGSGSSPIWELTAVGDELEEFCSSAEGHLFIAGRFEGMDFPDATCRVAVLPSLPLATGALERFVCEQLKDASFLKTRMLERIKQGIGRCTRGTEDYAIYYFLDTRFYAEMESKAFAAFQSERTLKQVELGLELTQNGMGAVVPVATKFLRGGFSEFDQREAKAKPPSGASTAVRPTAASTISQEVEGWRALFERRDFAKAAACFESVSGQLTDAEREHRGFWKYMEAFSEYLRHKLDEEPGALERCLNHLNRAILEGGSSSWFNRLRKARNKLKGKIEGAPPIDISPLLDRWDELVEQYPYYKGRFLKWQASLKAYIDGTHNQVCEALQTLGHILGFTATRPMGDGAPDGLWAAKDHVIVLEAKIETERDSVSLGDVNQTDGHRRGATRELQSSEDQIAALIVTSMSEVDGTARGALGSIRILSLDLVGEIQTQLETIMRNYWKGWVRDDATTRSKLRREASKLLPPPGWLLRAVKSSKGPFLTDKEIFKEWPK